MDKLDCIYKEFIDMVNPKYQEFVNEIHTYMMKSECKMQIKSTSSGYLVSYQTKNKKSIANFVFRKKGLILRIYGELTKEYPEFLDSLPDEMVKTIEKGSVCKRLINFDDCNPKCVMGYDFTIKGKRYQKCRNSAFMFLLREETNPFLIKFLENEMIARSEIDLQK